jgi:hypothetical protein
VIQIRVPQFLHERAVGRMGPRFPLDAEFPEQHACEVRISDI